MGDKRDTTRDRTAPQRELIAPAARNGCYSLREIRRSLRAIASMRRSRSVSEQQVIESELPRGLVAGFEAVVQRADDAIAQLTRNHPKRRKLLDSVEDLPFTTYGEVVQASPQRLLKQASLCVKIKRGKIRA